MDPNANLAEMLAIASRILNDDADIATESRDTDTDRLAELVKALDGWITQGGFLPERWNGGPGNA